MKNRTYLASLAMVLALASNVQAEGYVKAGLLKYGSTTQKEIKDEFPKLTDSGFQLNELSVSGGYIINNNIDVNGGLSFLSNTNKFDDEKTTTTAYSLSLGVNYLYKVDNKLSPYAGLGVRYSNNIEKITGIDRDDNGDEVAASQKWTKTSILPYVTLGTNYLITENVGLDLNVKYFPEQKVKNKIDVVEGSDSGPGTQSYNISQSPKATTTEVGLNLLVKF